jgi:hypothetical protein
MNFLLRPAPGRAGCCSLPLFLALAAVGCGRGVGDVSGKVTYDGSPVAMGSVVLVGSDGIPHSGQIDLDGTYAISGVPAETVKVAVLSPDPGPPLRPGDLPPSLAPLMQEKKGIKVDLGSSKPDRRKWRRLPKQYENPHASGLTMEVTRGENTQNITLKR